MVPLFRRTLTLTICTLIFSPPSFASLAQLFDYEDDDFFDTPFFTRVLRFLHRTTDRALECDRRPHADNHRPHPAHHRNGTKFSVIYVSIYAFRNVVLSKPT